MWSYPLPSARYWILLTVWTIFRKNSPQQASPTPSHCQANSKHQLHPLCTLRRLEHQIHVLQKKAEMDHQNTKISMADYIFLHDFASLLTYLIINKISRNSLQSVWAPTCLGMSVIKRWTLGQTIGILFPLRDLITHMDDPYSILPGRISWILPSYSDWVTSS